MEFWVGMLIRCAVLYYLGRFAMFIMTAQAEKVEGVFDDKNEIRWCEVWRR